MKRNAAAIEVIEEMGCEDQFTAASAIGRCSPFMTSSNPAQSIRDVLSRLVGDGVLLNVALGVYRWTQPEGSLPERSS